MPFVSTPGIFSNVFVALTFSSLPPSLSSIQVGTDIQDNKCSWLVVQALERATPEQREVLEQNYAIDEEDKVH